VHALIACLNKPSGHPGGLFFICVDAFGASRRATDDPSRLRRSVRKLLDLEFDALLVGDGASNPESC
jgi:hypothetical protein